MRIQSNPLSQFSPAELHFYLEELPVSLAPPPKGGRAAQVAVLEAAGLERAAQAVTSCGAIVHVDEWKCGTKRQGETIHAHRYGCCKGCDCHVMSRTMDEHKEDDRKLPPGGQWQRYWLEGPESDATRESLIRLLKNALSLLRKWLGKEHHGRVYAQHDSKRWVIRGIFWVAPEHQFPAPPLGIGLKPALPRRAFLQAQAWMLTPLLDKTPQGELRGHIMVAVHGLNRLRSYGKLLGGNAEKTEERVQIEPLPTPDMTCTGVSVERGFEQPIAIATASEEKTQVEELPTPDMNSRTGVGLGGDIEQPVARASEGTQRVHPRDFCPNHGPSCTKQRSYTLLASEATDIPKDDRYETARERRWREMQEALKWVAGFDLAVLRDCRKANGEGEPKSVKESVLM